MKRLILLALLGHILSGVGMVRGEEIQFVENFALAPDRGAVLQQLIPATEDYYYFYCLHYQHLQQFDKVDQLLEAWIQRYQYTDRVREILNRQALLTYDRDPQKSLNYIRQQLNLQFNHERISPDQRPQLPTALDPQLIATQALIARALADFQNLEGFEDEALHLLAAKELPVERRRDLLRRLTRPDYQDLPLIVVVALRTVAGTRSGKK